MALDSLMVEGPFVKREARDSSPGYGLNFSVIITRLLMYFKSQYLFILYYWNHTQSYSNNTFEKNTIV